ncbi:MAG: ferritin family protein [Thermoplasmatales archaeon]|nr:MAG: ferritin family protein [Thermoplasmatales archaeon]
MVDYSIYDLEDLLLAALKSEVDSKNFYLKLAKRVNNYLLKDKLKFLAKEEEQHKVLIEEMFKQEYPRKDLTLPKESSVPLPEINITDEDVPISKILGQAMEAEKAAHDFYLELSKFFEKDVKIKNTLMYFATMEMGHYKLLEVEKESMESYEIADEYWPMMHIGP